MTYSILTANQRWGPKKPSRNNEFLKWRYLNIHYYQACGPLEHPGVHYFQYSERNNQQTWMNFPCKFSVRSYSCSTDVGTETGLDAYLMKEIFNLSTRGYFRARDVVDCRRFCQNWQSRVGHCHDFAPMFSLFWPWRFFTFSRILW